MNIRLAREQQRAALTLLRELMSAEEKEVRLKALQQKAAEKQKRRKEGMGDLLRSKGFIWLATSNTLMGGWQQVRRGGRLTDEKYFHHDL